MILILAGRAGRQVGAARPAMFPSARWKGQDLWRPHCVSAYITGRILLQQKEKVSAAEIRVLSSSHLSGQFLSYENILQIWFLGPASFDA